MSRYIILILVLMLPAGVVAEQLYNPYEERWETVRDQNQDNPQSQSELKYNAFEDEWSYERPDAEIEYNPYEDQWEYAR